MTRKVLALVFTLALLGTTVGATAANAVPTPRITGIVQHVLHR